jgi:CBS domain-containing protein
MTVRELLKGKGGVVTLPRGSTIRQAMEVLIRHNIGAVVIVDEKHVPVGIVSERDIMREAHNRLNEISSTPVEKIMSSELIIGLPDDSMDYVQCIFTSNRIRHLPIIENGKMIGIISIGDVVKARLTQQEIENRYLRDFIMDKYPG